MRYAYLFILVFLQINNVWRRICMDFNTIVRNYENCDDASAIKRCIVALGGRTLVHAEYSSEDEFQNKIVEFFNTSTPLKLESKKSLKEVLLSIWVFEDDRVRETLQKIDEQPEISPADFENYPLSIPRR